MRTLRLFAGLVAVSSITAAVVTGCGNDETPAPATETGNDSGTGGGSDSGPGGNNDGSTPGTDGSTPGKEAGVDSAVAPVITANASDLNVYLGQTALPNATATTVTPTVPLTFSWTVESVPTNSTITTVSLFNSGSATPSFQPDLPGAYGLKVTVSADNAQTVSKTITVNAFEAKAMFIYTDGDGGVFNRTGVRAAPTITDAATQDLTCYTWDAGAAQDPFAGNYSIYAADLWEAPAGGESRAVLAQVTRRDDAGTLLTLIAVSGNSTCAMQPTVLDSTPGTLDTYLQPRFSPNGERVAYVYKPGTGDRINTIAFDGSAKHTVAPLLALADGGPAANAQAPDSNNKNGSIVSPRWLNDTTIGWLNFTSNNGWQIVTAADADNSAPSLYMACAALAGDKPQAFAFLPDGSVLVSQRVKLSDAGATAGARDLLVYSPNATTKQCELVRNLTQLEADSGAAFSSVGDWSISPDGTQVAFVKTDHLYDAGTGVPSNSVWTASINGLIPPSPVPHTPKTGAFVTTGPRWLAGGALLAWPQDQRSVDAGDAGGTQAIMITTPSGNVKRIANSTSPGTGFKNVYAIGNGTSCSIAAAGGSGVVGLGAAGAFVAALVRRRRRSGK